MWASPPTHRLPKSHASHSGRQTRPPLHTPTAPALCPHPVIPSQCSHWRGNPYPPSLPPSQREVSRPKAVTEGEICRGSAAAYGAMWASPPTHRLSKSHASHSGGQTRPPLRPSTVPALYPCSVIPRARSARGNPSPFHVNSGPWPPPTFAAAQQRRDLTIATPRRVFPKREGRSPPSLVAQGWGIFKGEGRSKLPSPLNGAFGYFCRY